jgi:hypothetical protein
MKELFLNIGVFIIIGSPCVLLDVLKDKSKWVEKHYEGLICITWVAILLGLYFLILPMFNLEYNLDFFTNAR